MAGTRQAIKAGAVIAVAILAADRVAARQEPEPTNADRPVASEVPRVRTDHPVLATLIREGISRSTTFRRVVDAIQTTDGVVYIEQGRCGHGVRACLVLSITVAGPHRVLRVVVEDLHPEAEAIAAIAHELYHALEILGQPSIRTMEAIYFSYEQHGSWRGGAFFETDAAVDAGNAVHRELRKRTRTGN
jgi:hypothetical protein